MSFADDSVSSFATAAFSDLLFFEDVNAEMDAGRIMTGNTMFDIVGSCNDTDSHAKMVLLMSGIKAWLSFFEGEP